LQELAYGFYDGITGLVTQPVRGAQERGVVGAIAGIGKGVGGLVLKPGAGLAFHCNTDFEQSANCVQDYSDFLHTPFKASL
jgi:hypothetical protein